MKHAFAALSMAVLCCVPAASAATADLAVKNELARDALKEGQFAKVIAITGEIASHDEKQPLNWYRMAIAATRTNDFRLALKAITTAEMLDPSLSFASSPGHVERLKATVRAGLAGTSRLPATPENASVDAVTALPAPLTTADPGAASGAAAAPPGVGADPGAVTQALAAVSSQLDRMERASASAAAKPAWQQMAAPFIGFAVLFLAALATASAWLYAGLRKRRELERTTTASMPLTQLIQKNRDDVGMLLQRLRLHGHTDTELFLSLSKILPSLERESGRVQINLAQLTQGRVLIDTAGKLSPRPMVLGQTDARTVHQQATRSALQSAGSGTFAALETASQPEKRQAA